MVTTRRFLHSSAAGEAKHIIREAETLHPTQWSRELVQNALDAGATEIRFDYLVADHNSKFMRVTDNGHGMPKKQLEDHMSTLRESGDGRDDNHGVGARYATLGKNMYGVEWISRAKGSARAHSVMVYYDEKDRSFVLENNETTETFLSGHGTSVILYGPSARSTTWSVPSAREVLKFITLRYRKIKNSEGVPVSVKIKTDANRNVEPTNGFDAYADKHALHSGVLHTKDADIFWHVFPTTSNRKGAHRQRRILEHGFVAVENRGELFGHNLNVKGRAPNMNIFGLYGKAMTDNVCLIVRPKNQSNFQQDDYRKYVEIKGSGSMDDFLSDCAKEFCANMPEEIKALQGTQDSVAFDKFDIDPEWLSRLNTRPVAMAVKNGSSAGSGDLTGLQVGSETLDPSVSKADEAGASGGIQGGDKKKTEHTRGPNTGETEDSVSKSANNEEAQDSSAIVNAMSISQEGADAVAAEMVAVPDIQWVAEENWEDSEDFQFSIVQYISSQHVIRMREHAGVFENTTDKFSQEEPTLQRNMLYEFVKQAYSQEIIGKVLHTLSYFRDNGFAEEFLADPKNLTATLLGFHGVERDIRERINSLKRGKRKV